MSVGAHAPRDTEWDDIIVGAGSAGAVVAARLSEDSNRRVLLLEAGIDFRSADTPEFLRARTLQTGLSPTPGVEQLPEYYWTDIKGRRRPDRPAMPYRRGKGLGGSSLVNGMVAVRPEAADFDGWVAMGADGWGWADVADAFNRMETDLDFGDRLWHGDSGPVPIYREPESGWGDVDRALREAAGDDGHAWHDDYNEPGSTGISRYPANITAGGRRMSTSDAYLEPVRDASQNLTIRGGAHVVSVVIESGRAVGVRLIDGEVIRTARDGEVILSAGAIGSPAILLRSGIGPEPELRRLGAPVLAPLPVGEGLQDHAIVFVQFIPRARRAVPESMRPTNISVRYSSGLPETGPNDMVILATNHNYWFGNSNAGLAVQLNESHSRGRLWLPSLDPLVDPVLEENLLEDQTDATRLMAGVDRALELMSHPSFRALGVGEPIAPRGKDAVMAQVSDVMHACSTARMGAVDDDDAVVDSSLRVRGIDGLRVADASVYPKITSANLHITTVGFAEHAARVIAPGTGRRGQA